MISFADCFDCTDVLGRVEGCDFFDCRHTRLRQRRSLRMEQPVGIGEIVGVPQADWLHGMRLAQHMPRHRVFVHERGLVGHESVFPFGGCWGPILRQPSGDATALSNSRGRGVPALALLGVVLGLRPVGRRCRNLSVRVHPRRALRGRWRGSRRRRCRRAWMR